MTCVVGLVENNKIYMGADSVGANNDIKQSLANPKIFTKGEMLFGCSTSWRMTQVLQHSLKIPLDIYENPLEYFSTIFIDEVRNIFKEKGFGRTVDNNQIGGTFLIGYKNQLFSIEEDFSVLQSADGIDAIGHGKYYALGALQALKDQSIEPLDKVKKALEAANYYSPFVLGPYTFFQNK